MPLPPDIADKQAAIRELVPGRSFADVGGLWGLVNEMVSVALKADASSATMIDIMPLKHPSWLRLRERVIAETPRDFISVQANACAPDFAKNVGKFDVVHSSGIIYHAHNPIDYLMNLRDITREYLIVSSMTLPEKLSYDGRELDLSGGRFLSAHALDPEQAAVINAHFAALGLAEPNILENSKNLLLPNGLPNSGPWWWLFTVESLRRLLSAAGLDTVSVGESWPGRAHTFLCRPQDTLGQSRTPVAAQPEPTTHPQEDASGRALGVARQTFSTDPAWWAGGIANEARFWANQVRTGGGKWKEVFQVRISAKPPLDERLQSLVVKMGLDVVDILDVGAGPVTTIGSDSKYCSPRVRAVDPLAPLYADLLAAGNITPRVETEFAPAEALSYFLTPHSFDVVHCRNALDHSINPLLGILQMLRMLRRGGLVYLRHHANEAEHAGYTDFHQFNLDVRGESFFISNPGHAINVGDWLSGIAEVETWAGGLGAEVIIRPVNVGIVEFNFDDAEMAMLSENIRQEIRKAAGVLQQG